MFVEYLFGLVVYMRRILHCDLNNFFATVECHENPVLFDYPTAVCGDTAERRGIILAKNELAKKYNVKTAEPLHIAKLKCPSLVIVRPHYDKYIKYSNYVKSIYLRYTDEVEPFGIDECWLDVTGSRLLFGSAYQIAQAIRRAVKNETGLTISVGVSYTKVLAKLANDIAGRDSTAVISPGNISAIAYPLPADRLMGVGQRTFVKLKNHGIYTIGDIVRAGRERMSFFLGKNGVSLWQSAAGLDTSPVIRSEDMPPEKSISCSETTPYDMYTPEQLRHHLIRMADNVCRRLRASGFLCRTIQVTVRCSDLSFLSYTRHITPTRDPVVMTGHAMKLFCESYDWSQPLRAAGIGAAALIGENEPFSFTFDDNMENFERSENLYRSVDAIAHRYGRQAISRASLLTRDAPDSTKAHGFAASRSLML